MLLSINISQVYINLILAYKDFYKAFFSVTILPVFQFIILAWNSLNSISLRA
jgi:hypothetical protein